MAAASTAADIMVAATAIAAAATATGAALAGLAGLAIGSALAGPYYYGPAPAITDPAPTTTGRGPGPGYATCYASHRVWDGYRWIYERTPLRLLTPA